MSRRVEEIKHKHGIDDPSIKTMEDLKGYVKRGDRALENFNKIHKKEMEEERRLNWITGLLDTINQEAVEFILMQISQTMDPDNAAATASHIVKTSSKNKIPLGMLLTFLSYERILQDPVKSSISSIASILNKYFWNKGLHTLEEVSTGIDQSGQKVTGGYTSEMARIRVGNSKVAEGSEYSDTRPFGYNEDRNLKQRLLDSYQKLSSVLTNKQN